MEMDLVTSPVPNYLGASLCPSSQETTMNSRLAYHANVARIEALVRTGRLRPRTAC
jgi:hypothetical protein